MKRTMTAFGAGICLLLGTAAALVLFPNTAGAHSAHSATAGVARAHVSLVAPGVAAGRVLSQVGLRANAAARAARNAGNTSGMHSAYRVSSGTGARFYNASTTGATYTRGYAATSALASGARYYGRARTAAGSSTSGCPHMNGK